MARNVVLVVTAVALLLLSACSGYRELSRPWNFEPVQGEFESAAVIEAGDEVRITASGGQVFEGLFIEADEGVVTIAETSEETRIASIPVVEVERFEVTSKM